MIRHSWSPPVVVEVPWSRAGGKLYTCRECFMTRQSEPHGQRSRTVYTSIDGTVTTGKTPPCTPSNLQP